MNPRTKSETSGQATLGLVAIGATAIAATAALAYDGGYYFFPDPLARLDIESMYLQYHVFIDTVLFFMLFLAIVHATLHQQFKGRGGAAASVAISAALTIGLVLAERTVGFSLRDFGPLAAAMLIGTVAITLYRLVHHLGLGAAGSGALAFAVAYLGVRAAMPGLFALATANPYLAWIHLAAVIALLVFVVRALMEAFHGKDILMGHAADALERPVRALRQSAMTEKEADQFELERQAVGSFLRQIVDRPWKGSAEILADLAAIRGAIRKFGSSPEARRLIAEKIRSIAAREHVLLEKLKVLKELNDRLRAFDLRLLSRLQSAYEGLDDEERRRVKDLFSQEVQKIGFEEKIPRLEQSFVEYDRAFRDALQHLVAALRLGQTRQASECVDKAIAEESRAEELLEEIEKVEQTVNALTRLPLSALRPKGPRQLPLFR